MEDEQDSGLRGAELLKVMISLSERAGNIARRIRKDDHLIKLLTQQKGSDEANPRFVQDFKTLADVLIQETVRHYIGLKVGEFPELSSHIKGEESAKFSNIHGETVTVEVKETQEETAKMLCKVLDGDETAAEKLAEEVHQEVHLDDVNFGSVPLPCYLSLPIKDLGIWIDPIDSTAEYIAGDPPGGPPVNPESMVKSGLHCVTVLIGAYHRNSGVPLMGVINQPFYLKDQHGYMGRACWGVKWGNTRAFSSPICDCASRSTIVAISGSESPDVKASLEEAGYRLCQAAGAGYKLLCVILGIAQAYILTRDSTYKWDTCAPHAILRAQGGDILIRKSLGDTNDCVTYSTPDFDEGVPDLMAQYCNSGGIVAYRSSSTLNSIISALAPG